jgi:hypothetical protein
MTMNDTLLSLQLENIRPLGEAVCARLTEEIHKLGFPPGETLRLPFFEEARCARIKDTYTGQEGWKLIWADERGIRIGNATFHGDGTFYAEFDVARPHPKKRQWFVEAVSAWGQGGTIKSEPKLLPAL